MGHRVIVNSKARRDLRRIGAGSEPRRILDKLIELGRDEQNLDVKALQGARPWLRLRVGDYRVLYALAPGTHTRSSGSCIAGTLTARPLGSPKFRRNAEPMPSSNMVGSVGLARWSPDGLLNPLPAQPPSSSTTSCESGTGAAATAPWRHV